MTAPGLTAEERFWAKVEKTDTCWLWIAALSKAGYGDFWDGTKRPSGTNRIVRAHRFSYELNAGPIPDGLTIDHICHTPACVRPEHLRPATHKQQSENRARFWGASRVRGVSMDGRAWRVRVMHGGTSHYGGTFSDLDEAEAVAIALRNGLFTHNDLDRSA